MVGDFNECVGIEPDGMSHLLEECKLVNVMTRLHTMSGVCGSLGTKFYMIQMTRPCPTLASSSWRKYSTFTVGHIYCALETSTTAVDPCRRF